MTDGPQAVHTNRTCTGAIAHESKHDWWLELGGVAEISGRTVGVIVGGTKLQEHVLRCNHHSKSPTTSAIMTLLLGHLPRTHPPPPPTRIAPWRSSTTNPLTLQPVLPFQTSARFQRPSCAGSLSGELDISSCSMWAIGLWTLRKFIENTAEWNTVGGGLWGGSWLPFLNCQCT